MPGGPASPVQLVAPAIAYHQSNSKGVTGTRPCERLNAPTNTLNIHTHTHTHTHTRGPNTQRNRAKQVHMHSNTHPHIHALSWASLLVTALVEKKRGREGWWEKKKREETGQTTQVHRCNWSHCKAQASIALVCNEQHNTENEVKSNK